MHEEDMVEALRAKGYKIRKQATGLFILRYRGKKNWGYGNVTTMYHFRKTLRPAPGVSDTVPDDAEIAEIDPDKLEWKPFWPKKKEGGDTPEEDRTP